MIHDIFFYFITLFCCYYYIFIPILFVYPKISKKYYKIYV